MGYPGLADGVNGAMGYRSLVLFIRLLLVYVFLLSFLTISLSVMFLQAQDGSERSGGRPVGTKNP